MIAGDPTILCIDDDPLALEHLKNVLTAIRPDLRVRYFGSAAQALAAQQADPADIVISDLRLGSTTGLNLIADMRLVAPQSIYMLLSGDADLQSALNAVNEQRVFRFFIKPATEEQLRPGIMEAVTELNLRRMRAISGASLEAVGKMGAAVAFVDLTGRIIYANSSAKKLFHESDVFQLTKDQQLTIRNRQDAAQFSELLQSISTRSESFEEKCVARFTRSDSAIPINVSVMYCNAGADAAPFFNLVFSDPSRKNITSAKAVAAALDLTPSEARIVYGLAEGANVEEAAKLAGVSLSTARTYIKNVFSKTGVSRQAELVRLTLLSVA
jgi:DNA-binding NarL/FixJ family response regulator